MESPHKYENPMCVCTGLAILVVRVKCPNLLLRVDVTESS